MNRFEGFTQLTNEYYFGATVENTREYFERNREKYETHVRAPLRALHEALVPAVLEIDPYICTSVNRCVSKAYNDFRHAGRTKPIKTYCYIHFCANMPDEEADTPGLFFDASYNGYRYGLCVYHDTTAGWAKVREYILSHLSEFRIATEGLTEYSMTGEAYKRDRYPDAPDYAKRFLNMKYFYLCRSFEPDEKYFSSVLADDLTDAFVKLGPFYRFLVKALKSKD